MNSGKPAPADAISFHESIAKGWAGGYARPAFARRLNVFRAMLDRTALPDQFWLDLGCGAGVLTRELLARSCRVVGVDGSLAMLDAARAYCADARGSVAWRSGDAADLSFVDDGTVDGVLCSSVVEYLSSAEPLFEEVARVLRPGGSFVVSIPPTWSLVRTVQKAHRRAASLVGVDRYPYLAVSRLELSRDAVRSLVSNVGLRLEESVRVDAILPTAMTHVVRPSLIVHRAVKVAADDT